MQFRIYARPVIGLLAVACAVQLDFLIEGESLVTGAVADVIQAPHERWRRATSRAPGMPARRAITPRNKEGQVYDQPDAAGGDNR
jgi:hypothetical protein